MKIKLKFKRALFALFKEEILKAYGYHEPIKKVQVQHVYLNVEELRTEILLDGITPSHIPIAYEYQKAVERAKEQLFKECMKYIVIDNVSLMNPEISRSTAIKVSLFVGRKNQSII